MVEPDNSASGYQHNMRTYALLTYHYNSFHHVSLQAHNLLDNQNYNLTVCCPFVSPSKKHANRNIQILHWKLNRSNLLSSFKFLESHCALTEDSNDNLNFYFPSDLGDEYPGMLDNLGAPHAILHGVLSTSGRSIWVFGEQQDVFCLKIDTMQLSERKYFSERALLKSGLHHAVRVSEHLKAEKNIFSESEGLHLQFTYRAPSGESKRYTYLVRRLNFKKTGLLPTDFLIPITALLSKDFWANTELLTIMGLQQKSAGVMTVADFIPQLAAMIRRSLDCTFFHYEVHQQNLTLVVREGLGVKLLYHDLEDTLFDPVTFFLHRVIESGLENIATIYDEIFKLQQYTYYESQGRLILKEFDSAYSCVASFYRRHIRNFGLYTRTLNFFNDEDYVASRTFEDLLLSELGLGELADDTEFFLKKDLFWNIDRYHRNLQLKKLDLVIQANKLRPHKYRRVDSLMKLISEGTTAVSVNFPIRYDQIEPSELENITDIYDGKVFIAEYNKKPVCLIHFNYDF